MLPCRVFVVIRNGMKSVVMCEWDFYGWVCLFQGRYMCNINMYIFVIICCVHTIRPDKRHPIIRKPL